MDATCEKTIYTIGHSTHSIKEFISMLQSFNIQTLVDVRSLPGSRKFPQFNAENLKISLKENNIEYIYLKDLGGRRKLHKDSMNDLWRNPSFRSYADYMETSEFEKAIEELEDIACHKIVAYMCAEAVWWRCHRSMISDYLKAKSWTVLHIMAEGKSTEHPYTSPARIEGDHVYYHEKTIQ
jgi:uncharacterized protein (DUF488 family)